MHTPFRPAARMLSAGLLGAIVDEAFDVLSKVGVYVENAEALRLLEDGGAVADRKQGRVFFSRSVMEGLLKTSPHEIVMYDSTGAQHYVVGGDAVHFDPGSAALRIFDHDLQVEREPVTTDLIRFSSLVDRLEHLQFQSTGIVSGDVPPAIADSYRMLIALSYCRKPVVTGTFSVEGFIPMYEMLKAIRGGKEPLRRMPLAIFDACPSAPLVWSNLTTSSVIDCARAGIPSELIAVPMAGATGPATLTGSLVQHTAENLAGLAIAQCACPGAPVIFGGSSAIFDMRVGAPPLGAIETMMLNASHVQIGKSLGLPTHAYMGLSDAKSVDAQAGFETGMGAVLAALAGVNVVSGAGMLDFENCQSLEKLVIDNEVCGMAYRLIEGITQREETMAIDLLQEIGPGGNFLSHPHTLAWYKRETRFPQIVDRGRYDSWVAEGKPSLSEKASLELRRLLVDSPQPVLSEDLIRELHAVLLSAARQFGIESFPT